MARPVSLSTLTVSATGRPLLERIDEAIAEVVRSVADPARGEVGSVSLRLKFTDLGNGEVACKPELTRNPAKEHFDARVLHTDESSAEPLAVYQDDPAQLDIEDLARMAAQREAEAKARRKAEREAWLEGEPRTDPGPPKALRVEVPGEMTNAEHEADVAAAMKEMDEAYAPETVAASMGHKLTPRRPPGKNGLRAVEGEPK